MVLLHTACMHGWPLGDDAEIQVLVISKAVLSQYPGTPQPASLVRRCACQTLVVPLPWTQQALCDSVALRRIFVNLSLKPSAWRMCRYPGGEPSPLHALAGADML